MREKSIFIKCIQWVWEASCKESNVLWICVVVVWYWKTEGVKELWTAGEWQSYTKRMKCGGGEKAIKNPKQQQKRAKILTTVK